MTAVPLMRHQELKVFALAAGSQHALTVSINRQQHDAKELTTFYSKIPLSISFFIKR